MPATSPSASAFRITCWTTRTAFARSVIDNFADSYALGETPVPCIECNRSVKFRDLLKTARELGATALATGHYVASRRMPRRIARAGLRRRRRSRPELFPVRDHARAARLSALSARRHDQAARRANWRGASASTVADKQDSQDICFVPTGRYTDIIGRLRPNAMEPGDIVDLDGRVIGRHQGIVHFTVGQRRGLGIAAGAPLYVVRLDAASRRVVVGPREALRMDRIVLRDVNWIGDGALDRAVGDGLEIFVRVRSTRAPQPAWLRARDGGYEVELVAGEEGVSPGPGLRVLRCAVGTGARARRRLHPERDRAKRCGRKRRDAAQRRWSRQCADK